MKLNDLTGKTAIVTGAAQGLSCGMAEGLMEAGAKVCIMDINPKAEETAKQFVNGAGVQRRYPSEEFPLKEWDFVINVNLRSVFALCQLAGKTFMKQDSKGKIINIASMLSFFGGYTVPAYAASKGGVAQVTKALCNEWAEKGINVNALAPGYMATEMNTALLDPSNPRNAAITNRIPKKEWGTPDDMKGPVVWLASDASDYINGAVIPVDGGYLVR